MNPDNIGKSEKFKTSIKHLADLDYEFNQTAVSPVTSINFVSPTVAWMTSSNDKGYGSRSKVTPASILSYTCKMFGHELN